MEKIVFFVLAMIVFMPYALKKKVRWQFVVPFFLLSALIIFNAGLFDRYSFLDSDLIFHKSLVDNLADKQLFTEDQAIRFYSQAYPRGFHYLLAFLGKFNLSVPQISKLLGLMLSLLTPFLFYFIGLEVYRDNTAAFLSGLFCSAASIGSTIYIGLPRSIAFVFFLAALYCFLKYSNNEEKISFLLAAHFLLLLMLLIHPYTFIISWFVCASMFLVFLWKRKGSIKSGLKAGAVIIFFNSLFFISAAKKTALTMSSWSFLQANRELFFSRVPYAFVNFYSITAAIGIVPISMLIASLWIHFKGRERVTETRNFFLLRAGIVSLLLFLAAVINVDRLFFLRAHRFAPFLSAMIYLGGIFALKEGLDKFGKSKSAVLLLSLIMLLPGVADLGRQLQAPAYPYNLNINGSQTYRDPHKRPGFEEILSLAAYAKKNIPKAELIACPLDLGDMVRMFVKRPVTASWKIGGMITVFQAPLDIYREQITASRLLYSDPLALHEKYGINFFLFEKDKRPKDFSRFEIVWQGEKLCLCKLIKEA